MRSRLIEVVNRRDSTDRASIENEEEWLLPIESLEEVEDRARCGNHVINPDQVGFDRIPVLDISQIRPADKAHDPSISFPERYDVEVLSLRDEESERRRVLIRSHCDWPLSDQIDGDALSDRKQ